MEGQEEGHVARQQREGTGGKERRDPRDRGEREDAYLLEVDRGSLALQRQRDCGLEVVPERTLLSRGHPLLPPDEVPILIDDEQVDDSVHAVQGMNRGGVPRYMPRDTRVWTLCVRPEGGIRVDAREDVDGDSVEDALVCVVNVQEDGAGEFTGGAPLIHEV